MQTYGQEYHLLVAIADEKVRIKLLQIQLYMSNTVCAVDTTQNSKFSTRLRKSFKWHPQSRQAHNGVEDSNPDMLCFSLLLLDNPPKLTQKPRIAYRVRILHLDGLRGRRLRDVYHAPLTRPVDGIEVDDDVAGCKDEVPQDGVDACGCILDEDACICGDVEEFGYGGPRLI